MYYFKNCHSICQANYNEYIGLYYWGGEGLLNLAFNPVPVIYEKNKQNRQFD
jgi:hypothetical protein